MSPEIGEFVGGDFGQGFVDVMGGEFLHGRAPEFCVRG